MKHMINGPLFICERKINLSRVFPENVSYFNFIMNYLFQNDFIILV